MSFTLHRKALWANWHVKTMTATALACVLASSPAMAMAEEIDATNSASLEAFEAVIDEDESRVSLETGELAADQVADTQQVFSDNEAGDVSAGGQEELLADDTGTQVTYAANDSFADEVASQMTDTNNDGGTAATEVQDGVATTEDTVVTTCPETAPTNSADLQKQDEQVRQGQWVVDTRSGKLERYWIWSDGSMAKDELITPENGAGYYARALSDGRILRGKWDSGMGRVYIADNNGKLIGSDMANDGWVVTDFYDGHLERYYVDAVAKAACSGFFSVEGYGDTFGMGGAGYVVRCDFEFGNRKWSCDNDGKLRSGWYVTSGFGQGLQRYWMGDTVFGSPHAAALSRLIDSKTEGSGYDAYAMAEGYILRGKWDSGTGRVYIADNEGKLIGSGMEADGWVVTDRFDGHLERYYVDAVTKAAYSGFFTVPGYGDAFGRWATGFVVRGALNFGTSVILADNDGKLPTGMGWLVTNIYGQGLQRYWIQKINGEYKGSKPGYSAEGYSHYTTNDGYVLRGKQRKNSGMIIANNDGEIAWHTGWLITDKFDGEVQRYYFDDSVGEGMLGARVGLFTVDGKRYYGREDQGYVVRGVYVISQYYGDSANAHGDVWHDDVVAIANNDGVLMSREEFGLRIVQYAQTQLGTSYTTEDNAYYPGVAFNCSGLTWWVYSQLGVHLPHNQGYYSYYAQQNNQHNSQMYGVEKRGGWKTSTSDMNPGDLVFFSPVGDKYRTGHVGIYVGNGQMIDCTPPGGTLVRNVSGTSGFVGGGFPITLI
ncbi:MAG: NlpC/P60 family protein [Atopobiaceae bacterium]|nr:NlpC/P60 family protein [Atopobiaceae bacterium]